MTIQHSGKSEDRRLTRLYKTCHVWWHLFLYQLISLPSLCANLQSTAQWRRPSHKVHIIWFAFFVCCLLFKLISDHFLLCLTNISWHPLQWDVYFTLYILYMKIICRWGCNATNNKALFQGFPWSDSLKSIALPYGVTGHMVIWSSAQCSRQFMCLIGIHTFG